MNDNRNYNYTAAAHEKRPEYPIIKDWIPEGSRVVDLGCGNGSLIQQLTEEKSCHCAGVELSESGVRACLEKGLDVRQGPIDTTLPFEDDSFDVAVCNVTVQMVLYPEVLLQEMKRIAKYQIISFPNFAYFKNRLDLLLNGRMPRQLLFGYTWYNTGHIHQLSLRDMQQLIQDTGNLKVIRKSAVPVGFTLLDWLGVQFPNLFQKIIILETVKD